MIGSYVFMPTALMAAIFCGSAVLSGLLVEVIRQWALRRNKFDVPNERSSHTIPTPRGGGLAIVVVTLTGWILINVFVWHRYDITVWAYPLGAGFIAAVSWIDDLKPLPTSVRFAVHAIGAIIVIVVYGYWQTLMVPGVSITTQGWIGILLTFLWIVGLTNAFNFMDGLDGIAATQAIVAGLGWVSLTFQKPSFFEPYDLSNENTLLLGLLISGASLGFLWHNRPPAKIFMGDVSSAFLGFSFAVAPLLIALSSPMWKSTRYNGVDWPMPGYALPAALLVWPFLFDTIFTFIRRALKGEKVWQAHRSHLFQRLNIAGRSHGFVTLFYGVLAVGGALVSNLYLKSSVSNTAPLLIFVPLFWGMWFLWNFTRQSEIRAEQKKKRKLIIE